jgi:O-antigen ligase
VLLPLAILGALLVLGSWVKVRIKIAVGLAIAAALLGTLAAATLANNATLSRIAARFDQQQELRPDLWRDSLDVARGHFPFGVGMGNFVPAMVAGERLEIVRPTMPNRAHNEVLELAVEGGIFALLLLGAGLALLASAMRRAWAGPPEQSRPLAVFASCGLVLLMLHSLVDYPLRSMALAGLGAACAGMLFDRPRGRNQPGQPGQPDDIA